jgi:hypothetical protein
MWIIIWCQTRWIISCGHNYLMHSKIIIQNHSTLAVLSNQLDVLCANPMKIKIPKRVMPLMKTFKDKGPHQIKISIIRSLKFINPSQLSNPNSLVFG